MATQTDPARVERPNIAQVGILPWRPSRGWLLLAAVLAAIAVVMGAYAAHGLGRSLEDRGFDAADVAEKIDQTKTAALYQMFHALALLAIAASGYLRRSRLAGAAAWFWLAGIALFSGGLYSLAIADRIGHWAIVPAGGLCLIVGWGFLALSTLFFQD